MSHPPMPAFVPDETAVGSLPSRGLVLRAVREASWLTRDRARAYRGIILTVMLAVAAIWIGLSHGGRDAGGKPLGTDFVSFWTASRMALGGHPGLVYSPPDLSAAEQLVFPDPTGGYYAFFYPPAYLLVCLPLALLPYLAALVVWLGAGLLAYWRALRAVWPKAGLTALAFPAVFVDLGHGQNGFFSAALFAAGLVLLERRPMLAGLALGALACKPQFLPLLPFVLLAAGRWRAIAGAVLAGVALLAVSSLVFGASIWADFLGSADVARVALEQGAMGFGKLQSAFGALRLWGVGVGLAYGVQGLVGLAILVSLLHVARRNPPGDALVAATAAGTLLATPFLLDYDLLVLAVPMAWLMRQAGRTGFRPCEKIALAAGFALPLGSRLLATQMLLPLAPLVLLGVFLVVLARLNSARPQQAGAARSAARDPSMRGRPPAPGPAPAG